MFRVCSECVQSVFRVCSILKSFHLLAHLVCQFLAFFHCLCLCFFVFIYFDFFVICNGNTLAKKRESDNTDVIVTEAKEKLSIAMQLWRKNFKSNIKRKNLHFYFCKSVRQNHKGLEFSVRSKQASSNDYIFCWCF